MTTFSLLFSKFGDVFLLPFLKILSDLFLPFSKFGANFFSHLFDNFRPFKTTFFFVCYAVQILSTKCTKCYYLFLGCWCKIKAIPRTAFLLPKRFEIQSYKEYFLYFLKSKLVLNLLTVRYNI
jgi:hypothetical protein